MRCFVSLAGRENLTKVTGLSRPIRFGTKLHATCRQISRSQAPSTAHLGTGNDSRKLITIGGKEYVADSWCNVSSNIAAAVGQKLHLKKDHPISITRQLIESKFPSPTFKYHNNFFPVVSTHQNFDSLGFPLDHPGRSRTDTYYINKDTVLRTHTSAHQADTFRANESEGYLISADVYRRDAIDRSHYPVFHQMEGARMWDRSKLNDGNVAEAVLKDFAKLPTHNTKVEDPNPPVDIERNPLQVGYHSKNEVEAIAAHLKRSLELVVVEIFSRARVAATDKNLDEIHEPLRIRWVEAYFPFTSPSWEMEIFWQGAWLEVLGCGVVKQEICINADIPKQVGWAFGIGLERLAMLLFEIPDIRLFWSEDKRFLGQFEGLSRDISGLKRFVPYSKHPACYKDVAFWLRSTSAAGGRFEASMKDCHENDVMEVIRDTGGDNVEDVKMMDEFTHPATGRKSRCYRINYRSLTTTLRNEEVNVYHRMVEKALVERLGVELR